MRSLSQWCVWGNGLQREFEPHLRLFESFKQTIQSLLSLLLGSLYRARDKGQSSSRWNAGRGQEVDSGCGMWVPNKANGGWAVWVRTCICIDWSSFAFTYLFFLHIHYLSKFGLNLMPLNNPCWQYWKHWWIWDEKGEWLLEWSCARRFFVLAQED